MHGCEYPCAQVTKLLESLEFIFIPFVNPDGYAVRFCDAMYTANAFNDYSSCSILGMEIACGVRTDVQGLHVME